MSTSTIAPSDSEIFFAFFACAFPLPAPVADSSMKDTLGTRDTTITLAAITASKAFFLSYAGTTEELSTTFALALIVLALPSAHAWTFRTTYETLALLAAPG